MPSLHPQTIKDLWFLCVLFLGLIVAIFVGLAAWLWNHERRISTMEAARKKTLAFFKGALDTPVIKQPNPRPMGASLQVEDHREANKQGTFHD